ncbi:PCNA-inhibitor [Pyrococcus abyssi]|uniref:Uncharacterized protein n=1 Tax=Pyrococcus abyssi (strain GE5 / Orsay) TaxID=272844 RepID=G8ZKK1_PYRAB|nr:PCNA-inhibitor [Pyrococcus abyssi]CCE70644.1 TPA: hypothetical protein PAB0806.1n [Pyrococcus abyssi GE5]
MDRKLDDFININFSYTQEKRSAKKNVRKKLRETNLDSFLPEEHIEFFKNLRIGSKRIARKKIEGL